MLPPASRVAYCGAVAVVPLVVAVAEPELPVPSLIELGVIDPVVLVDVPGVIEPELLVPVLIEPSPAVPVPIVPDVLPVVPVP